MHQNTTIKCAFQFVSGKHTFECTTRLLLDKLICMNLLFPGDAALTPQYVQSPSGLSDRMRAAKKAIIFHPKASACALFFANSLRFRTGCSLSVILSAFQRRAQYL